MTDVKSFETVLRAAANKEAFIATCAALKTPDVRIDKAALSSYAAGLRKPNSINSWDDYRTPGNSLEEDFIELAVSTVQQGGYLYADDKGQVRKWEIGGSGAKALLAKMDQVRAMGALPALHIQDPVKARGLLSGIFNDAPYSAARDAIWAEMARPEAARDLKDILQSAATADGGYRFGFETLKTLAFVLPEGFGEDPFLKKASLLTILFAGVAHHKLKPGAVTLDIPSPADYRDPQTLHNIGILRYSDALAQMIESEKLLAENHFFVTQIRAQTILANVEILHERTDLQIDDIDGEKWYAGRLFDVAPDKLDEKKAKIRRALESHGQHSGFDEPGFLTRTTKPMNVGPTLRF